MSTLTEDVRELVGKKVFAHLATLMPDGSPQSSPVWVDLDGDQIRFNTAEGRAKARNVRNDPRVALSFSDPDNPYMTVMVRGEVTEITSTGADDHIDDLAKKYLDEDTYPFRQPDEERLLVRVRPDAVSTYP
jgi:PPOX class probable F420-dependent enzyme